MWACEGFGFPSPKQNRSHKRSTVSIFQTAPLLGPLLGLAPLCSEGVFQMYPWQCRRRTPTRLSLDGIGQILVGNLSHCLSNSSLESTGAFSMASLNGCLLAVTRCRGTINPDTLIYVALASVMYQCTHIEARTTAMPCSFGELRLYRCNLRQRLSTELATTEPLQNS